MHAKLLIGVTAVLENVDWALDTSTQQFKKHNIFASFYHANDTKCNFRYLILLQNMA